tara:strand:+ start:977 stop:1306 length:330 start_codon:yes stop_codon:yes gene_type:complete
MVQTLTKSLFTLICAVLLLQGCTAMGPRPAEAILGSWQTTVGKFPMVVTYDLDTVQSGSNSPIAYEIAGDELTYAQGGKQVRMVSFTSAGEMIQTDPITGTVHHFSRVP